MTKLCNHERWTADCHECGPVPTVRRCVHNESTDAPCLRCADLRAGEVRLRAVNALPDILAADDDFRGYLEHERRRWLDTSERHAEAARNEQHPAATRELYAERARQAAGRARFYELIGLLHAPTVAPNEKGKQSP